MIRELDKSLENNPGKLGCFTLIFSVIFIYEVNPYLVDFPIIYFLSPLIFLVIGYEMSHKEKLGFGIFFYLMYFFSIIGISIQMDGESSPSENPFISLGKYINLGYWEYNDFGEYSYYDFYNPFINFLYEISTGLLLIIHFFISVYYYTYRTNKEKQNTD